MEKINVNDESAFTTYSEGFIFDLQKTFRKIQPELICCPILEMCLKIENAVFSKALEENAMPSTANVWTDRQAIMYYQELRVRVMKNLEFKSDINWRKIYEENRANPQKIINELLKDEDDKKISRGLPKISATKPKKTKLGNVVSNLAGGAGAVNKPKLNKLNLKSKLKSTSTSTSATNANVTSSSSSSFVESNAIHASLPVNSTLQNDWINESLLFDANNYPDSLLDGIDADGGDFNLGFTENDIGAALPDQAIAWDTNASLATQSSSNNMASDGTSIWQLAKEEAERKKSAQKTNNATVLPLSTQTPSITAIQAPIVPLESEYERSQREMKEKLNLQREIERKRREEEEQRQKELQDSMMMEDDDDWMS